MSGKSGHLAREPLGLRTYLSEAILLEVEERRVSAIAVRSRAAIWTSKTHAGADSKDDSNAITLQASPLLRVSSCVDCDPFRYFHTSSRPQLSLCYSPS